ncbi:hypothetical protein KM043_018214 [Ampulex compressa]|nr:hypothetical protein KM043_018214 [Ampulex compressa]
MHAQKFQFHSDNLVGASRILQPPQCQMSTGSTRIRGTRCRPDENLSPWEGFQGRVSGHLEERNDGLDSQSGGAAAGIGLSILTQQNRRSVRSTSAPAVLRWTSGLLRLARARSIL